MTEEFAAALQAGFALALSYSPVVAPVVAVGAAALAGHPKASHSRVAWAFALVLGGWLVGDGLRALGRARDLADGVGWLLGPPTPMWAEWTAIAAWALGALALGYALPAWAGAFVGRRVTRGTGWMAAIAVCMTASAAVGLVTRGA
ncbi:MAG: hypothetical protein OEV43_09100 [Coriobacteriia bacterium]|nr:hypothetical protein [Coriobacteriia bacterium]